MKKECERRTGDDPRVIPDSLSVCQRRTLRPDFTPLQLSDLAIRVWLEVGTVGTWDVSKVWVYILNYNL